MPLAFPPYLNHWTCYDSSYRTSLLSWRAAYQKMTIHSRSYHPRYEPLRLSNLLFFLHFTSPFALPPVDVAHRRFLKARGYNASQAKQMILECIQWRRTVEDVGIEELYRSIDPFNVRSAPSLLHSFPCIFRSVYLTSLVRPLPSSTQFPERQGVFECWPMGFHKVRQPRPPEMPPHTTNVHASDPSLSFQTDKVTPIPFLAHLLLS